MGAALLGATAAVSPCVIGPADAFAAGVVPRTLGSSSAAAVETDGSGFDATGGWTISVCAPGGKLDGVSAGLEASGLVEGAAALLTVDPGVLFAAGAIGRVASSMSITTRSPKRID